MSDLIDRAALLADLAERRTQKWWVEAEDVDSIIRAAPRAATEPLSALDENGKPRHGQEFPRDHQEAFSAGYLWGQRSMKDAAPRAATEPPIVLPEWDHPEVFAERAATIEALTAAPRAATATEPPSVDSARLATAYENVIGTLNTERAARSQAAFGHPGAHIPGVSFTWSEVAAEYGRLAPRAATEPPLTRERLAAALHADISTCLFPYGAGTDREADHRAHLAQADTILAALTPTSAPEPGS